MMYAAHDAFTRDTHLAAAAGNAMQAEHVRIDPLMPRRLQRTGIDRVPSWPAKENSPMASPHTLQRNSQANWMLMTAIHDALRRDLDQLIHTTDISTVARAGWIVFRDQLSVPSCRRAHGDVAVGPSQGHRRPARPSPAGCNGR